MSGCVSGILDRMSVYLGQPENSMVGSSTTAMSPDVFGPDMRNLTHCAPSTTEIRRSLGSGNLLEPVVPVCDRKNIRENRIAPIVATAND